MKDYIKFIETQIQYKKHIVISGAIGSGKSTLLNELRNVYGSKAVIPGLDTYGENENV